MEYQTELSNSLCKFDDILIKIDGHGWRKNGFDIYISTAAIGGCKTER